MFGRLFFAIVAGWLTTVGLIGLFLALFSKDKMDALGAVAVALGVTVAVVAWRAMRRWAPRNATALELREGFDVHLGPNLLAVMILLGLPSFGIFALLFWMLARSMPRRVDPQGMTLRNGRRISWNEVTTVREVEVRKAGIPIGRRWEISSPHVTATVVPVYLAEGRAVLQFLSQILGKNLLRQSAPAVKAALP